MYLLLVVADEENMNNQNLPFRFYRDQIESELCPALYLNIMKDITKIEPIISYIIDARVSQWLEENFEIILNSTRDTILNSRQNQTNAAADSGIPGLWTIMDYDQNCTKTFSFNRSVWNMLVESLTSAGIDSETNNDEISYCIVKYEKSLYKAYLSAGQSINTTPKWNLGKILSQYLSNMGDARNHLHNVLQSYLHKSISLQDTLNKIEENVNFMSFNISDIKSELMVAQKAWTNEVINWNSSIVNLFSSIISEVLSFNNYLQSNDTLLATVVDLFIWMDPTFDTATFLFDPKVNKTVTLMYLYLNRWLDYLREKMDTAISPNFNHTSEFVNEFNSLYDDWTSEKAKVITSIQNCRANFVIDEQFVR